MQLHELDTKLLRKSLNTVQELYLDDNLIYDISFMA